jgi:hypothetical protein
MQMASNVCQHHFVLTDPTPLPNRSELPDPNAYPDRQFPEANCAVHSTLAKFGPHFSHHAGKCLFFKFEIVLSGCRKCIQHPFLSTPSAPTNEFRVGRLMT